MLQYGMLPMHISTIMQAVVVSDSKMNVFSPAVCPLVERSPPTRKANNNASTSRKRVDQIVTVLAHSPLALILPSVVQVYNLILIKSYLEGLPPELEESAKIDGANNLQIMFKVLLPVSLPCVASVSLFTAVTFWNNYTSALIYLGTEEKWYPLSLYILNYIQSEPDALNPTLENIQKANIESAMIVVSILPILIIYPFVLKFFTKGVTVGSVKG